MLMSKTIFKEYTRCKRVCALDELYKYKTISKAYQNDEDLTQDLLGDMFDDVGEDLVNVTDEEIELLLPYYNMYEEVAINTLEKRLGKSIIHSKNTKEQKSFSFDKGEHTFIAYLDGYLEEADEISVFEVKSTTSKKFLDLKYSNKGEEYHLFEKIGNTLVIRKEDETDIHEKYVAQYSKLFDRYSDVGKYVYDLAIQKFIIENSLRPNKKARYYLVVLNRDYVYDGSPDYRDVDGESLVLTIDLSKVLKEYSPKIEEACIELLENIKENDTQKVDLGRWCERKERHPCPFAKAICFKDILSWPNIFEYFNSHTGFNKHDRYDLINQGMYKFGDIPREWLGSSDRIMQRDCFDKGIEYIEEERISKILDTLEYPLYHLDFESFHVPLPRFIGERPYTQSVFQFSLHIEKVKGVCDLEKDHYEYLAKDQSDCREELIEKLCNYIDLKNGGTVIVYNDIFEKGRLAELSEIFTEYKDKLLNIRNHVFDLECLLEGGEKFLAGYGYKLKKADVKKNFYDSNMHGSYSIKKVLPIFAPSLSYDNLTDVHNGKEAIVAYAKFSKLEKDDLEELRKNLVKYCRQDTYAMFVCMCGIREKIGNN